MWSRSRKALVVAALLIVALGLRLGEVERTAYRPIGDATSYLTLASQIAHTGDYSNSHARGSGARVVAVARAGLLWLTAALVNGETPRFRAPIDPFLILLASCALAELLGALAPRLAPARRERGAAAGTGPRELVEMRERLA